jgi:hypothetical protein
MLRNVFLKSLRDQRRALLGWSIGILLLVVWRPPCASIEDAGP